MESVIDLINQNDGVIMLALLALALETRIHMRDVHRRLDNLERGSSKNG